MLSNLTPVKKIVLALAAMCIVVSVITANNLASVMMLVAARNNNQNANAQAVYNQQVAQQQQNAQANTNTNNNVSNNTNNNASANNTSSNTPAETTKPADDANKPADDANKPADDANKPADNATQGGEKSVAEIADMYNKAVNNAKANAKTVIRVKDGATNYNNIVEAGNLSSIASSLMGLFMVGSKDEIEAKNEEWTKEKLPPENAQAALTADGIKSAECKEEGDYYIVTVAGKDEVNPKSGGPGVGSLCGVIQEETITGSISSVPGLELNNISISYENVVTIAKIEKSTGNLVALTVEAPCILQLSAKVPILGSIDNAKVGIGVYTEYTIEY